MFKFIRFERAGRVRRAVTVIAVSIALAGSSTPAQAAVAVQHGTQTGLFCPCWGGPPKDATAWENAARNMSLIAGGRGVMEKNAARAHSINPDLLVLPYTLGPYISKKSKEYTSLPEAMFAHDSNGRRINVPSFPNNILMDLMNPAWRERQAQIAATMASKLDGVYVDSMGPAPTGRSYTSAQPVDPVSKEPYTAAQWLAAARDTLTLIKERVGSKYVLFNGISSGASWAKGTKVLADSTADGAMTEAWIRGAKSSLTAYPSLKKFQQELDEMEGVLATGKQFFAWTKTWASGTAKQKEDWNTFALAAFLLADNGQGFYNFLPENGVDRSQIFYPIEQVDLGPPLGRYVLTDGVYTREFANGTVTVSPSAKTASIDVRETRRAR